MMTTDRFPFVRQRDSMQCGAACMMMVCRHHGARCSWDNVTRQSHLARDGMSVRDLCDLSVRLGMEPMAIKTAVDQLPACPLPCILHWNQNHYVVLYGVKPKSKRPYMIADPGKGKYRVGKEEMERRWASLSSSAETAQGVALLLEPTEKLCDDMSGNAVSVSYWTFILDYVRQYRGYLIHVMLGLVLACVLQLALPLLTQRIVDTGIAGSNPGFIRLVLLGELMIVAGHTLTDLIRRRLMLHVSMRIDISIVGDFIIKLLRLPMEFFEARLTGDILQRIGDHSRVKGFLTEQVLGTAMSLMTFILFGTLLAVYDLAVFGIFMVGSALYVLWTVSFLPKRRILDSDMFEAQASNRSITYQLVTCMQEIKLQGCGRRRCHEWEDSQADLFGVQLRQLKMQQTQEVGSVMIGELRNVVINAVAAAAVIDGRLSLGGMLAIQYVVGQLTAPVSQIMAFIYSLQDLRLSLERISEVHMRQDEESRQQEGIREYDGFRDIKINGLKFSYDPYSLRPAIDGMDMHIKEGEVTAIVGKSGSGKSTLLKLILGYYRTDPGMICVAGKDIGSYDLGWWRSRCGVVMQEGVIFSESIARNIANGDDEIDMERLRMAASTACIDSYIESLPLGYNTIIGREGKGLSQGQKQRILVARAVYRNPDFLLLDEATNSLDADNEKSIVDNLARFYKGRTVIIVAHRLSTVRNADRIVVLDKGHIMECGSHDELVRRKGEYYNLIRNQLELGG